MKMERASLLKIAFLVVLMGSALCDIASTKKEANQWRKHHPRSHHRHHRGPAPAASPPSVPPSIEPQPPSLPPLMEPPPPSQPPAVETPPLVETDAPSPSPSIFPPPYWQLSPYQPHGCGYPCQDSNDCDWPCTSCCDNSTCCDDQTSLYPIPPHPHSQDLNQLKY